MQAAALLATILLAAVALAGCAGGPQETAPGRDDQMTDAPDEGVGDGLGPASGECEGAGPVGAGAADDQNPLQDDGADRTPYDGDSGPVDC